jgi:hypothetical protein
MAIWNYFLYHDQTNIGDDTAFSVFLHPPPLNWLQLCQFLMDSDALGGDECTWYTASYIWLDDGFVPAIAAAQNDLVVWSTFGTPFTEKRIAPSDPVQIPQTRRRCMLLTRGYLASVFASPYSLAL